MLTKEEAAQTQRNLTTEISEESYVTNEYSVQYEVAQYENEIEHWPKSLTLTINNEHEKGAWPDVTEITETIQIIFHNDDDTLRNLRNLKVTVDAMLSAAETIHAARGKKNDERNAAFTSLFSSIKGAQEEND